MVMDLGFTDSQAASVSTVFNTTSVVSMLLLGLVKGRKGLIGTLLSIYIGSTVLVGLFSSIPANLLELQFVAGLCGFFAQPGIIATNALVISSFEVDLRSTGLGLVIGVGRGAAALSPLVAGALFAAGSDRVDVSMIFAGGSALAAFFLFGFAKMLGRGSARRLAPYEPTESDRAAAS